MNRLKKCFMRGAHTCICMGCLTALLLLLACSSRDDGYTPLLREAEDLIRSNPDSALSLLDNAKSSFSNASEPRRMRYMLIHGKAQNMAYVDFTSDEDVKRIVSYYDEHGTTKDRMQAYYLMGCVYRDLGEVPLAVENFQTVVSLADTTSADCDLRTLSGAYSQLGDLYNGQLLLTEEIECRRASAQISLQLKDSLYYIYDYSRIAGASMLLNDNETAEEVLLNTINMYNQIGEYQRGLNSSITLMVLYAKQPGSEKKLRKLVQTYDRESTAFDVYGNLPPSKVGFYKYKALCFEAENNLDSAEFYYRKMAYPGMDYVSKDPMYRGLFGIFQKKNMPDSIAKYANLFCEANDSSIAISDRELTAQIGSMYRYARLQKVTQEQKVSVARSKERLRLSITVAIVIIMLLLLIIQYFRVRRRKKQRELETLQIQYVKSMDVLSVKNKELDMLKHSHAILTETVQKYNEEKCIDKDKILFLRTQYEELEASKLAEIEKLRQKIIVLRNNKNVAKFDDEAQDFKSTVIAKRFLFLSNHPTLKATKKEWKSLFAEANRFNPELVEMLYSKQGIKDDWKKVCLLLTMGFNQNAIAALTDLTPQRVTNIKGQLNFLLFHDNSAKTLLYNVECAYGTLK